MAAGRRRVSNGSDEEELDQEEQVIQTGRSNSPVSSDEGRPLRQTSIRLSRRTTAAAANASSGSSGRKSATRNRRPTPIVRARRSTAASRRAAGAAEAEEEEQVVESYSDDEETQDQEGNSEQRAHTKYSTTQRRNPDGSTTTKRSRRVSRRAVAAGRAAGESSTGLSWYERIMPNFMLNMTAPLTGYENEVADSDVDEDEEYAILDRSRIKRNRRIRRRLVTFMLLAAAASLFMYTRGRLLKKVGVRAAVCSMKQRIEDGLSKTVQETMGK